MSAVIAICAMTLASSAGAQADGPGAFLKPYVGEDGELSSTGYGWLSWKFSSDKSEQERWSELMQWAIETTEKNRRKMQDRVRELGYDPVRLKGGCGDDQTCEAILVTGLLHPIDDWPSAKAAIDEAVPLFAAYMSGIRLIEASLAENEAK